ncbi:hypothetical protein [Arthrobacter sp. NicSoilB4]|uniref:hypothetical protein n=1 Tax=Arthrobacter sp. NicSoilB4 TaxID=2830997 RepID=UPI001CC7CC67|nr:hypothetical protein [Arthrobacter sp. NicSoilB4]
MDYDAGRGTVPAKEMQPLGCVEPPQPLVRRRRRATQQSIGQYRRNQIWSCARQCHDSMAQPHDFPG